jgi:hypothetical protein
MNIKILIACHKPSQYPKDECFLPIHVGHINSNLQLGYQGDDEGDSISEKNYCYCELTGQFWAWKNLKDADIVGLCHYRRYFDFHKQCIQFLPDTYFPMSSFNDLDYSIDSKTIKEILGGRVVVPKALPWNETLQQQYCENHISDDYRTLESIIKETQPAKYVEAFNKQIKEGYKLRPYNMMVMRRDDFDAYCSWLFDILSRVEKAVDISHYSNYQKRIFGFMSERLMSVWLDAERKQLIELPVIIFDENCKKRFPHKYAPRKTLRYIKSALRCARINRIYRKSL